MLEFENIFAILMFPDIQWLYIKKRKALHCKTFRISNHPCSDKKVRNTGGVHMAQWEGFEPSDGFWPSHDFQSCSL